MCLCDVFTDKARAQPLQVVSVNLSPVERLVVCDESRWFLLDAVLLARQFDALPDAATSPRPGRLETWR